MSSIASGSQDLYFFNKEEIVDHLLKSILANRNRKIGTEWEMFLVDQNGHAITREKGQLVFAEFQRVFAVMGYASSFLYEEDKKGTKTMAGLDVPTLGVITPEIGHQIEFACTVCETVEEAKEKNEEFFTAVHHVAANLGLRPVFKGHIPDFAETTQGSYRSRSVAWYHYYAQRFGDQALSVSEALGSTASTQVSIDSGGDKFHEFFQALLLIEPALTLYYAQSLRPHISVTRLPASHTQPIVDVWKTKTPREAVAAIVDRILQLDVPFLPHPDHSQIYQAEPLRNGKPPCVMDLMSAGRLNEKTLNNIGGFLLCRPALRRFSQGLLEMRGVDAQSSPEKVAEVAHRVETLVYYDKNREALLADYAYLSASDLLMMHHASNFSDQYAAMETSVAGTKMADFVENIIERSPLSLPLFYQRNSFEKRIRA